MKIHIYEGTSRVNALKPLVENNEPPKEGLIYSVKRDSGILIVAFPDVPEEPTDFEFDYWIDGYPGKNKPDELGSAR